MHYGIIATKQHKKMQYFDGIANRIVNFVGFFLKSIRYILLESYKKF